MKPNAGGQLAPENIVGRDELIARLWGILDGRGVYMNDVRRIGKTQILVKMHAETPADWSAVKRDLGGCHSAAEFATQAYRDAEPILGLKKRSLRRMEQLVGSVQGMEIAGVLKLRDGSVAHWKEVLTRTFTDIDEEMAATGGRMVFLWDEVPFLLDNIRQREGPLVAMEVLDVLRSLAQDHDRVRLLLTGSIGLHHILAALQANGYIGSPLNRMEAVRPGPLEAVAARQLAEQLLRGAELACNDFAACAARLADAVGNVAFYIHKLVSRLPPREPVTAAGIDAVLDREIASPQGDWDLAHYRNRLAKYYGGDERLVLEILDAVALGEPLDFGGIRAAVAARQIHHDDEKLRRLLALLASDHYLDREPDGRYRFYLALIRRWWRLDRGL